MSDKTQDTIAATIHAVATNFGDHAETIVTAVEVAEDETVRALLERLIPPGHKWRGRDYEHFVTLRFVMPADVHDNLVPDSSPALDIEPF